MGPGGINIKRRYNKLTILFCNAFCLWWKLALLIVVFECVCEWLQNMNNNNNNDNNQVQGGIGEVSNKILYIVVIDDGVVEKKNKEKGKESFRYTRSVLQSTLQLMGCKARHAFKVILFYTFF